ILAACGLPAHPTMTGINLLDVCDGKPPSRKAIFGEVFAHDIADLDDPSQSALYRWCIQGRWKLILTDNGKVGRYQVVHPRTNREPQLYDLLDDPHETQNVAGQNPERTQALSRTLNAWWRPGS
ncbi:MAG: sulfatase, partial [Planctomycetaceae bacterium]